MRQIVLDTETTGLNARGGDRVIEIGCIEIDNRRLTGRNFHRYINPERASDPDALKVHGLTEEFLADKPKFAEVADELMNFVAGAEIVIHNAAFDVGFLDAELARLRRGGFGEAVAGVIDTLHISRELNPGKRHNLDALCERYGISNSHRVLHGALLDAQLLAEVYLAMTRGQETFFTEAEETVREGVQAVDLSALVFKVLRASDDEVAAHEVVMKAIEKETKKPPIWTQVLPNPESQL
ncbi:DNA polymerase III subunit epsilon [Derxia gummosa]|uniref:DNA polymerase III subunit epsilon n=1 Tax=Derxia gummosa DSM 723 TaxID=1121388 RepID=A0A8B6X336_9BURK|nr:DNA polymerase III subunit epsilon [Derxia gummosa]